MAKPLYDTSLAIASVSRAPSGLSKIKSGPLVVSGFYQDVLGIGRGVEATARGLETAGLPVVRHNIRPVLESEPYTRVDLPAGPGGVWIQHCNAPENELLFSHIPPEEARDRYCIAYWAWELPAIPRSWRRTARAFHEIWTPSRFVAKAVQPYARKVRIMPHPVEILESAKSDRTRFNLPAKAVVFAAFADARSALARKNPMGAINAYRAAFPQADGSTFLSIKVVSPEADPEGMVSLRAAADGRADIRIWSEKLSNSQYFNYIQSIDVVVSLHRAEGFGLVIAEAYIAGKVVVATGWSGNVDFAQPASRMNLIKYDLVSVEDPSNRYKGGCWAEPDIDAAAMVLRRLAADPVQRQPAADVARGVSDALHHSWGAAALDQHAWRDFVRPHQPTENIDKQAKLYFH